MQRSLHPHSSAIQRWAQRPRRRPSAAAGMLAAIMICAAQIWPAQAQDALPPLARIGDAAGRFSLEAPTAWTDVTETDWSVNGAVVGTQVTAAPDLVSFNADWGTPGVIVSYSELLPTTTTLEAVLDRVDLAGACRDGGRAPLTGGTLTGFVQRWENCGGTATTGTVATLAPADNPQFYAMVEIYTTDAAAQPLIERILASFAAADATQPTPTPPARSVSAPPSRPGLAYTYAPRRDAAVVALLPDVYTDVASTPWLAANGEPLGYMLAATPDLAAFRSTWTTPGIVVRTAVSLTTKLDAASLLADNGLATVCAGVERSERIHITPVYTYTLLIDTYRECGGASTYTLAAAQSDPTDHLVFLEFQAVNAADRAALDVFLDSFTVERSVGGNGSAAAIVAAPATPTPTPVRPGGVVLANNLNVRSGPGTDFERLGAAPRGTTLPISGQRDNCAWLRVSTPNNLEGWVSGDPELFTLDTPCTAIPAVQP